MANEDGGEDRLTKNEFAELIQHLSVQEILTIEYRIGSNWSKLFVRNVPTQVFFCNLCVLETSSFKNLLAHIDGRKHKLQMERVKQLFHPDYTYPKNDKKEGLEKSLAETDEDDTLSSTINQPLVVADNDKEKSQNVENIKTSSAKLIANSEKNKIEEERATVHTNKREVKKVEVDSNKEDGKSKPNEETLNFKSNSKGAKNVNIKTAEKRSLADNNTEGDVGLKKRKIVVNPAAALSLKTSSLKSTEDKNQESNKKPQYQTDKIIIPTVHKNKSQNGKDSRQSTLPTNSNGPPKFSVKSYSSNPSDNDVYGILGVEYVIKILKSRNDVSPRYECGLCELVLDGFAMQKHLEGYNHRLKFCEKHFPTAIRQYRQYMQNVPEPEIFKVMAPVLAKLAVAIEQHHGRNLPYECYERDFSLNRHEILAKAFSCRHASEQYGTTFTHVVGSKEIDEFINNRHKYLPAPFSRTINFDIKHGSTSIKSNNRHQNLRNVEKESHSRDRHRNAGRGNVKSDGTTYKSYMSSGLHEDMYPPSTNYKQTDNINVVQHVDDETYNLMVDDFLKGTLKGFSGKSTLRDNRKRSLSPVRNSSSGKRKSLSPLRQNDIWQAYRHMVDQELYSLDERFEQYRKDPETHPSYNEEWQKFWKRRKDELVATGLDHRNYNYQPEWVRFVKIRVEELYSQEVENLKIKSRERLCLPLSNEHLPDVKYHVQAPKKNLTNEILTNPEPSIGLLNNLASFQFTNNNGPQVVSVLRLMTALEDSLGSLGPKIIDLLSKALQTEKNDPLHVNAIILNDDNCSLIETAKEKFKGLVITGLFEGSKRKVLKQVVNDADELLQYAYKCKQQLASQRTSVESTMKRTQNNSSLSFDLASANVSNTLKNQSGGSNFLIKKTQPSSSSITDNLLTRGDKKELASKLAASLVAQGKTDFDPQQLQQLLAVYKLIEKKKRENVATVLSNKESTSSSKKTLSDTLSDLLKSSSTSECATSNVVKTSYVTQSAPASSIQKQAGSKDSAIVPDVYRNCVPSSSFTSVLQNYSDNYFSNTAQSMANAFGSSGGGRNQFQQRSDYGMNNTHSLPPNQQNPNMSNVYNNQYQYNNRMAQNWRWNSNMEMNQNTNMGGPNKNFNQTSNWQNF